MPGLRARTDPVEYENYLDMIHEIQRVHGWNRTRLAAAIGVTIGTLDRRIWGLYPITYEALLAMKQVHSELMR